MWFRAGSDQNRGIHWEFPVCVALLQQRMPRK
jgi:hypothetical protein